METLGDARFYCSNCGKFNLRFGKGVEDSSGQWEAEDSSEDAIDDLRCEHCGEPVQNENDVTLTSDTLDD